MDLHYGMMFCSTKPDGVRHVLAAATLPSGAKVYRLMQYRPPTAQEAALVPAGKAHVPHMVILHTRYGATRDDLNLTTEAEAATLAEALHAARAAAAAQPQHA